MLIICWYCGKISQHVSSIKSSFFDALAPPYFLGEVPSGLRAPSEKVYTGNCITSSNLALSTTKNRLFHKVLAIVSIAENSDRFPYDSIWKKVTFATIFPTCEVRILCFPYLISKNRNMENLPTSHRQCFVLQCLCPVK